LAISSPAERASSGTFQLKKEREGRRKGGMIPCSIAFVSHLSHFQCQDHRSVSSPSLPPSLSFSLPPSFRIVDDILELFRLSSNRLQIDVSVVDIHSYFMTLCDLVQVITDKNQRRLERVLDPSLPRWGGREGGRE